MLASKPDNQILKPLKNRLFHFRPSLTSLAESSLIQNSGSAMQTLSYKPMLYESLSDRLNIYTSQLRPVEFHKIDILCSAADNFSVDQRENAMVSGQRALNVTG